MELSIEGERLLKAHDYDGAIKHFEAALRVGTDDNEVVIHRLLTLLDDAWGYPGPELSSPTLHDAV